MDYTSYEYRRYTEERGGLSRGNFDLTGSNMRVSINDLDTLCFPSDSFLQVAYTIETETSTQVGTADPITSNSIAPVNNVWNLFKQIRYKLNNRIISEIDRPGYIKQVKGLKYVPYNSSIEGRFNIGNVKSIETIDNEKQFFICGPKFMMDDLKKQLISFKVHENNIILEDFNIKK